MNQQRIKLLARRYARVIQWCDDTQCYIDCIPDLDDISTRGDTAKKVALLLDQCAEIAVAEYLDSPMLLPEPRTNLMYPFPAQEEERHDASK